MSFFHSVLLPFRLFPPLSRWRIPSACSLCGRCLCFAHRSNAGRFDAYRKLSRLSGRQNWYEILGVQQDATPKQLKSAFIRRSKETHPDLNPDKKSAQREFVLISEAYRVLRSPYLRSDYDRQLRTAGHSQATQATHDHEPPVDPNPFRAQSPRHVNADPSGYGDPSKSYYGIKGMNKLPNRVVLYVCYIILFIGLCVHFVLYQISVILRRRDARRARAAMDKMLKATKPRTSDS